MVVENYEKKLLSVNDIAIYSDVGYLTWLENTVFNVVSKTFEAMCINLI